ncbi:MAG: TerB family tellurite resistance protein [Pseudomonadota bacterium]
MIDKLFARFRQDDETNEDDGSHLRRAVAALLVEAARGDDEYTDDEKSLIDDMMQTQFSLDQEEAAALRTEAEAAQEAANDLYGFSRVVKEELDRERKLKLIEDMWVIALSDAEKAPYEEMIIRRLIGLIHLEDTDSALARRRAQERLTGG